MSTKEKIFDTIINESYNGALPFVSVFKKVYPFLLEGKNQFDKFYLIKTDKQFKQKVGA
jgi:hypothetical protein